MKMEEQIRKVLQESLDIDHLEVINESSKHHGHAGDDGSGQTHFKLTVVSKDFDAESRLNRHMLVNTAVKDLFDQGLHALSMTTLSPNEYKSI